MIKILSIATLALAVSSCASVQNMMPSKDSNANENMSQANQQATISSSAQKGLITMPSSYSVEDTVNRLVSLIESKGMKVFAHLDHQKNAASVDMQLRPTQVIMFGNPKAGTPLMQCEQTVAIDLPQKMLISEDAQGRVWLSYNDPDYLKSRHDIQGCDQVISNISMALKGLSQAATMK